MPVGAFESDGGLAERPAGCGDLVVRLDLQTAMPLARADGVRLRFAPPGCGEVPLDAAVGIDARGVRVAGALQ